MKKRAVMLLSDPYRPDVRLQKEINHLRQLDIETIVFAWDRENMFPLEENIVGAVIRRIKVRAGYSKGLVPMCFNLVRFWLRLFWHLMRCRCDLIHAHNLDTLPAGFIAAKIKRIKIIYDVHEPFPEKVSLKGSKPVTWVAFSSERFMSRRVDAIFATTNALKNKFKKWGAKNVILAANYADRHFYDSGISRKRGDIFTIGWIGSIRPMAGVDLLLAAMPEVLRTNKNVHLLLAGKIYGESYKDMLMNLIMPIRENVDLREWVPYGDLPFVYSNVDLTVSLFKPSKSNELAMPVKIFEAMACGVPVITTKVGEIQELVGEASCGLLIDYDKAQLADAICKMLSDIEEAARKGRRGWEMVKRKYNWESVAEKMVVTYQELLGVGFKQE